ncbi:MAG: dihydrolipoyl dehydrogenase [Lachnoclostridium edouardi]|uniref:dihydrolipoyl dehydrogenase n=1 Tax=Lachnoclostridium edouardi TaxID=1926283 RepID=UPI0026DADCFC|nr:dihydrolipoyl dehydrogenase [Lachnoclostridium edouardi]MDO4279765.1 dihydrolipoyl dehydrogenase [Lachnoclostridium edouardi]
MAVKYDLAIIGGGPGGYTAALKAASLGLKTVVIEKEKLGGVCLNRGCIPTKALLFAAGMFAKMQDCDDFGVSTDFISFDFGKMQDYKRRSVNQYRQGIKALFDENHIDLVEGTATIRRDKNIEVNGEEGKGFFEAENIIIATGAAPALPPIPGIERDGVMTSCQILSSSSWNYDRLTIIGGGVIGVEFATIFNALCSKVTILEKSGSLLGPMDREVSTALEEELKRKGIAVYCNASVKEIQENLTCVADCGGEELSIRSSRVLVATGRKPYVEKLFGADINIQMENGRIQVDQEFMTSEPGIYAVGDVISKIQLAHVAAAQGTYVVEKIAGRDHSIKLQVVPNSMFVSLPIVPSCIFTDPEIASVGITEETAREMNMKVRCGHYNMSSNGKSIIVREKSGFIRLVFEAYSNTIVGAQIMCPRATDMIGEMATAIANGLTAEQLTMAMRAHPTYSEGIAAAIEDAMRKA